MSEKKMRGEKGDKAAKEPFEEKGSVAPEKKEEPSISETRQIQRGLKIQTAEGWKRERRKEKMPAKKG
ncbi:hypothetical protein [Parachlamydia sp. AcF125]|uniref:hypothetical protein n=1 Tax=Parachlamydia sp. AcF125 TaxID=2795736 RepID=UPI001BC95FEF|nr:hypothetical protein [Parachlamydia sp. AcF125]MBS4168284.1 hypothetical protein [Parachlamydia sp. AcF125]